MKINMNILNRFSITAVFALLLISTSAFGDECTLVNAEANQARYSQSPKVCNGFDFCYLNDLTGSPNAELWFYSSFSTQLSDPFDTGLPFHASAAETHIYTEDGDIYMQTNGIWDLDTTVFAALSIVTGGTGKYENATGNVLGYIDSREPSNDYYGGPVYYVGRICGPNIPSDDDDDHEYHDNDDEYYDNDDKYL